MQMMARRLLCPLLTAHSSRLQTPAPAASVTLPDGLSCPKHGGREGLQLWVHYRQLHPPNVPPPHLYLQPSWVSSSFSPAASLLEIHLHQMTFQEEGVGVQGGHIHLSVCGAAAM